MSNPVIDCLLNHRSIRRFKPQPIEPETLELILQAGIRAPTAGNLQHYSLIVVDDRAKKRALLSTSAVDNPTVIISVVDQYRLKRWFELNDAPFYFDQAINLFIGYWDAICALHNVVVAAEGLGLGTVYIGMVLSMDLASALGTPEYVFPAGLALVGYPKETPELRPRLPLEAVVHRNGYQIPSDEDIRRFFSEKDQAWETLSKEQRQRFAKLGVRNTAQRATIGHYTEKFIGGESRAIGKNLAHARFRLTVPAEKEDHRPTEGA